jgi:hypothetical protein
MEINNEKIHSAINQYNIYRKNLVQAELCEITKNNIIVFFNGIICETCGYYDYYDDLQILLEDEFDVNTNIVEIKHEENGDAVRFQLVLNDTNPNV